MLKYIIENRKKCLAEMLGTAVLVFIACGTAVYTGNVVATGLAFGLVIVALAYTIGPISGAHVNPAVSFGMFVSKRMSAKDFGMYVLAQVTGAIIGGFLLFVVYLFLGGTGAATGAMGETLYQGDITTMTGNISTASAIFLGLTIEIVLTFIFVLVILGVTSKKGNPQMAGLVIGLTLAFVIMAGAAFTGPSVNPARSIGSAVFAGTEALTQLWMFIVAPLVGAALAALTARFMFSDKEEKAEKEVKQEKETA